MPDHAGRDRMDDALTALAESAAALPALFALVLADAFLVVVPGEIAVTAFAALSVATGAPALAAVIGVAAVAALCGDLACYAIGRSVGLTRWGWMRHPRASGSFAWARRRLDRRSGSVLFTARFIPFARLAVNLTAGAVRMPLPRYLPLAGGAALLWATYQALIGAAVARLLPGAPALAAIVAVLVALALGAVIDGVIARASSRSRAPRRRCAGPRTGSGGSVLRRAHPLRSARIPRLRSRAQVRAGWQAGRMDAAAPAPAGYDATFLAVHVPLPRPSAGRPITALTYPRFTVLLDTARRLAAATAVNIDGAALQDLPRTGEWEFDSRIPADQQTGPAVYAGNDLDRGHLVRRRDPGWGTPTEARIATEATFVFTNAAPQASVFNQSKDLWVGLEDHILEYADATDQRVSVFTAPVLDDADPPYRGILIPRRFWKVAAWATSAPDGAPELAATGFVLDQTGLIPSAVATAAPLGAFRTFQVPIADIACLTDIDFGPLVDADVLEAQGVRPGDWSELTDPADIRL
jgi:DNA/RNA endonuclease G (NUC1)/membrane protein DedA with SNARE-associated domain